MIKNRVQKNVAIGLAWGHTALLITLINLQFLLSLILFFVFIKWPNFCTWTLYKVSVNIVFSNTVKKFAFQNVVAFIPNFILIT